MICPVDFHCVRDPDPTGEGAIDTFGNRRLTFPGSPVRIANDRVDNTTERLQQRFRQDEVVECLRTVSMSAVFDGID